ncbi:MAG: PD-(D/E)XK nuclease family protein [Cyanobacteria bacterium P01_A01_bin.84]
MLSNESQLIRISQGQLNVLERCPRQFQNTYLEQLYSPSDPEHEKRQVLGSRFHLLIQQREMGLPIDSFLKTDPQIQNWMKAFVNTVSLAPAVGEDGLQQTSSSPSQQWIIPKLEKQTFRESEHYRTLQVQSYLLTVIYDLLIADSSQGQIIDWKTYPKPQVKQKLESNWQTRLYLYLLAETSDYLPENIFMTYWFFPKQGEAENIKFSYNHIWHQQTTKKLNQLLSQLTKYLSDYEQGVSFPQVPEGRKVCSICQYANRCGREYEKNPEVQADNNTLINLATIEEISL